MSKEQKKVGQGWLSPARFQLNVDLGFNAVVSPASTLKLQTDRPSHSKAWSMPRPKTMIRLFGPLAILFSILTLSELTAPTKSIPANQLPVDAEASSKTLAASGNTISVNSAITYQTIIGWEAVAQAGQTDFSDWNSYKASLLDQAVADGINRIKINARTNTEAVTVPGVAVNDNADPFVINAAGFNWATVDAYADVANQLKTRLASQGESL
ncbi:MAG TPA: hypothetical protein VFV61_07415, partial [Pyrinomonadaceae bacterium]|nr:hypothetical protein [Pyrinomonadaceae bacterium]